MLVVPIRPQSALVDAQRSEAAAGAVLGRTRARVLVALATGSCSTSELAARAGISASSASEHATALRRAGLIDSRRQRREVRHRATDAGRALLGWPVADDGQPFGHDRKVTTPAIRPGQAGARATNPADPGDPPHGRL
ncbi:winged helix-turn-helix domain-containing protein [Nostocoides australiense]